MYNETGYIDYWKDEDIVSPVPNFNPALDITKAILKDHCPQFPMTEEEYNALTELEQSYVDKAVYIQVRQVLDHFKWYVNNGASETVSSQTVGRTSISYDGDTMSPNDRLNPIAKSMLDTCGICYYGMDMVIGCSNVCGY